jgi:hypothetical protein
MILFLVGLRGVDTENDGNRITNVPMTNIVKASLRHSGFDIGPSFVIRHSSFWHSHLRQFA